MDISGMVMSDMDQRYGHIRNGHIGYEITVVWIYQEKWTCRIWITAIWTYVRNGHVGYGHSGMDIRRMDGHVQAI
jgi:hypothetical protein